ncbi:hypothetical protein, conserved [Plasmodium gonderi]|uniref:EIPR1-like beta-propeller domain-containing protein n=1 Tax=Plasmodium gonderi TaxID=77519 RepID=A0A1Y1JT42_PLAGO|nr:hypothetical protein, conserved [Plasmodium gonderi]GAW83593.1 hypothetical protein, conserved [Plasmodium gonderi]
MMYSGKIIKNSYYLPFKCKCLSSVNNRLPKQEYNLHYFMISSSNPFSDNEMHLIEYNDQCCSIRNIDIFDHKEEFQHMVCLDMHENRNHEEKEILLCTSALYSSDIESNNHYNSSQLKSRCSLYLGKINNFEDELKADGESETDVREQMEMNKQWNQNLTQQERQNEDVGVETKNDEEINDLELERKECFNEDERLNEKVNENLPKKRLVNREKKKKKKLKRLYDLSTNQSYIDIKHIAVDDYEREFRRIGIIDKYSYGIFERGENDMNFVLSKYMERELNYGIFDPHHENVIAVISDTNVYGYDIKSNTEIFSAHTNHKANLSCIDFNSNIPNVIITSSNDGYIKFWDLRFLENAFLTINIHSHWITSIHFNNFHDELLLSTSTDNTVKLHKIEYPTNLNLQDKETNYKLIKTYTDHEESVYQGVWSKTDAWIFASLSYDGKCVVNSVPIEQKYKILL